MKKTKYIPHPRHIRFEYSKITNYIYIGTNQCCQMHFKQSLLKKGVKADISVEKEKLDSPLGVDYFLWLPVTDHKAPSQKQLLLGAETINILVQSKVGIYVHCQRGHGRSPTLVAAYFILMGLTTNEAIKKIRSKRKVIHLTKSQKNSLKRFEKRIKRLKK